MRTARSRGESRARARTVPQPSSAMWPRRRCGGTGRRSTVCWLQQASTVPSKATTGQAAIAQGAGAAASSPPTDACRAGPGRGAAEGPDLVDQDGQGAAELVLDGGGGLGQVGVVGSGARQVEADARTGGAQGAQGGEDGRAGHFAFVVEVQAGGEVVDGFGGAQHGPRYAPGAGEEHAAEDGGARPLLLGREGEFAHQAGHEQGFAAGQHHHVRAVPGGERGDETPQVAGGGPLVGVRARAGGAVGAAQRAAAGERDEHAGRRFGPQADDLRESHTSLLPPPARRARSARRAARASPVPQELHAPGLANGPEAVGERYGPRPGARGARAGEASGVPAGRGKPPRAGG